jgi:group I intron endonuclease
MSYGRIYLVVNTITGRHYVGQTTLTIARRWRLHVRDANRRRRAGLPGAIVKYGAEAFDVQEVAIASSRVELETLERLWILVTGAQEFGYNLTPGGEQGWRNRTPIFGRKASNKTRAAVAAANRARVWSAESRAKVSIGALGRKRVVSTETREKKRQVFLWYRSSIIRDPITGRILPWRKDASNVN